MRITSIRTKMLLVFGGLILAVFLIGSLAVGFFLDDYYRDRQIDKVASYADRMEPLAETGDLEALEAKLQEAADRLGIRGYLSDGEEILYATSTQGFGKGIGRGAGRYSHPGTLPEGLQAAGESGEGEWILYARTLEGGLRAVFQIPVRAMEEALSIVRDFFIFMLGGGLLTALALSLYFSKRITDPVRRLEMVAESVRDLRFDVLYEEDRQDEIGRLGGTINAMAHRLEETIGALKRELEKEKSLEGLRRQFTAQVSHELKTPLSVIKGYAEALEDGVAETDEERRAYLAVISEEVRRMDAMILELLDLSQLQSGTFEIQKTPLDLKPILEGLREKYALMGQVSGRRIQWDCGEAELPVLGDRQRLLQVLENFMSNAWRHGDPAGDITLSAERKGPLLEIGVHSQGGPIDEKELPHLWDSFYKVDENSPGTGLGLAISKSILDKHGAESFARNTKDGSVFGFRIKRRPLTRRG